MSERKYSVSELDALRRAMENKFLWGTYRSTTHPRFSRGYKEEVKVKTVEEMVRTAMVAGHTAEDYLNFEAGDAATENQS